MNYGYKINNRTRRVGCINYKSGREYFYARVNVSVWDRKLEIVPISSNIHKTIVYDVYLHMLLSWRWLWSTCIAKSSLLYFIRCTWTNFQAKRDITQSRGRGYICSISLNVPSNLKQFLCLCIYFFISKL